MSITVKSRSSIRNCGAIDELISQMGFARSICPDGEVRERIKALQLHLYRVGAVVAAPPGAKKLARKISPALMDALEAEIHRVKCVQVSFAMGHCFGNYRRRRLWTSLEPSAVAPSEAPEG